MSDNTYHELPKIDWSDMPPQPKPVDHKQFHADTLALWRATRDVRYAYLLGMMPTPKKESDDGQKGN